MKRDISRRKIMGAMLTGAAAWTVLGSRSAAAQAARLTQDEARYQPEPHGIATCGNCTSFIAPSSCKTVTGTVSSHGWCKLYIAAD